MKSKVKQFFLKPFVWQWLDDILMINLRTIIWFTGIFGFQQAAYRFYDYLTQHHFQDDGSLIDIIHNIPNFAFYLFFWPLASVLAVMIGLDFGASILHAGRGQRIWSRLKWFYRLIGVVGSMFLLFYLLIPLSVKEKDIEKVMYQMGQSWIGKGILVIFIGFLISYIFRFIQGRLEKRQVVKAVIIPIRDDIHISFSLKPSNSLIEELQKDIIERILNTKMDKKIVQGDSKEEIGEEAWRTWQSIPDIPVEAFLELMHEGNETAAPSLLFVNNEEALIQAFSLLQKQIKEEKK